MGNPRFGRIEVFSHSINIIMSTSSWMAIAQICKTYLASFLHIFKKWNTRSYGSELSAWPEKYNFDHSVNKNAGGVNTDKKIFIFYLRPHFVGRIIVPGRSCFLRRSFLNSKHSRRCWRHFKFISISISPSMDWNESLQTTHFSELLDKNIPQRVKVLIYKNALISYLFWAHSVQNKLWKTGQIPCW